MEPANSDKIPNDSIITDVNEIVDVILEGIPLMAKEWSILAGETVPTIKMSSADGEKLRQAITQIRNLQIKFEQLISTPLTPTSSKSMLRALNRMFRLIFPNIPQNRSPIDWVSKQMQQLREVPRGLQNDLPEGLNYTQKHLLLRDFTEEITITIGKQKLDELFQHGISERRLVTPYQRASQRILLPEAFIKPPVRITFKAFEKVKLALHDVLADWGNLVSLVYGIYKLSQGDENVPWDSIQKVSLWDKVIVLNSEPRLSPLVKQEWVTMRNAIDHGTCHYDPTSRKVIFLDRRREIPLTVKECIFEGQDICLSNLAMLKVPDFVQTAHLTIFKNRIQEIRELANSNRPR